MAVNISHVGLHQPHSYTTSLTTSNHITAGVIFCNLPVLPLVNCTMLCRKVTGCSTSPLHKFSSKLKASYTHYINLLLQSKVIISSIYFCSFFYKGIILILFSSYVPIYIYIFFYFKLKHPACICHIESEKQTHC